MEKRFGFCFDCEYLNDDDICINPKSEYRDKKAPINGCDVISAPILRTVKKGE